MDIPNSTSSAPGWGVGIRLCSPSTWCKALFHCRKVSCMSPGCRKSKPKYERANLARQSQRRCKSCETRNVFDNRYCYTGFLLEIENWRLCTSNNLASCQGTGREGAWFKGVGDENAMTLIGLLNVVPSTSIMAKDSGPYGWSLKHCYKPRRDYHQRLQNVCVGYVERGWIDICLARGM